MNDENLKHGNPATQFRSGREAVEIGRKGGKSSGKTRYIKGALKKAVKAMLIDGCVVDDVKERLIELDIDPNNKNAIAYSLAVESIAGNQAAVRNILEILGEGSTAESKDNDLKQRKAELEYKKEKDTKMEKGINRSTEDDPITKALKGEFNIAD